MFTARLCTVLAAAGLAAAGAPAAHAAVTHSFDAGTGTLTITGDGADDAIKVTCVANVVKLNGATTTPAIACKAQSGFLGALNIDGGGGKDTIDLTDPSYAKFEYMSWAYPVLKGGAGDDTILGATAANPNPISLDDTINGGPGDDVIKGGLGEDTLIGGSGHNDLDGGAESDLASESADLNAGYGSDKLSWGLLDSDELTSVERLRYTGGPSANTVNFSAFPGRVEIDGQGGKDTLTGGPEVDRIKGGEGDDTLVGNAGLDFLYGGAGNDTLQGFAGDDQLFSDTGIDTLQGGPGDDDLDLRGAFAGTKAYGDQDDDTVVLAGSNVLTNASFGAIGVVSMEHAKVTGNAVDAGAYAGTTDIAPADAGQPATLKAGAGGGTLTGSGQGDVLTGGPGPDTIKGEGGPDTIDGGAGNDNLSGGDAGDTITGGPGTDTMNSGGFQTGDRVVEKDFASGATFTASGFKRGMEIASGFDLLDLTGTDGADVIDASPFDGNVILHGLGGADTLTGTNSSGDVIDAGPGPDADVISTLLGADTVLARNGAMTTIDCGTGVTDTGERDASDTTKGSCSGVSAVAGVTPTPTPQATPTASPTATPTATATATACATCTPAPAIRSVKLRRKQGQVLASVNLSAGAKVTLRLQKCARRCKTVATRTVTLRGGANVLRLARGGRGRYRLTARVPGAKAVVVKKRL